MMVLAVGGMKFCTKCGETRAVDCFGKQTGLKDGLQVWCKACRAAARRAHYERNRERILAQTKAYTAANLERQKAYRKRWYEENKDHKLARSKQWKVENREHYREQQNRYVESRREDMNRKSREWARANPQKVKDIRRAHHAKRRAATRSGLTTSKLAAWLKGQKKICYWCGARCARSFEIDHYEPLAQGGKHELSNLVISCKSCNRRKSAKDPLRFAREKGRLF